MWSTGEKTPRKAMQTLNTGPGEEARSFLYVNLQGFLAFVDSEILLW